MKHESRLLRLLVESNDAAGGKICDESLALAEHRVHGLYDRFLGGVRADVGVLGEDIPGDICAFLADNYTGSAVIKREGRVSVRAEMLGRSVEEGILLPSVATWKKGLSSTSWLSSCLLYIVVFSETCPDE